MGQLPKDQGLVCRFCARSGLLSLHRRHCRGCRRPETSQYAAPWGCGVATENRVWPVPCKEEKHGLRPAGPLLLLTPPATAQPGAGTKFLTPGVAAWSLWWYRSVQQSLPDFCSPPSADVFLLVCPASSPAPLG